jgi:hypothetical protein
VSGDKLEAEAVSEQQATEIEFVCIWCSAKEPHKRGERGFSSDCRYPGWTHVIRPVKPLKVGPLDG